MFLYLLSKDESSWFVSLVKAELSKLGLDNEEIINVTQGIESELGFETFVSEINSAVDSLKKCSLQIRRCVIMELGCVLFTYKGGRSNIILQELTSLGQSLNIDKKELGRLVDWSCDFNDFIKVGMMYLKS